ncbi:hypothetical protein D3C76_1645150 [compost metagenome]
MHKATEHRHGVGGRLGEASVVRISGIGLDSQRHRSRDLMVSDAERIIQVPDVGVSRGLFIVKSRGFTSESPEII